MSSQHAVVIKTEGDRAQVKYTIHENCSNCGTCGSLEIILSVDNSIAAQTGTRVEIKTQRHQEIKIILVEFVLPVFALFAGLLAGYVIAVTHHFGILVTMLLCTVPVFAVACGFAIWYDRRNAKFGPSIKEINV